MKYCLGSFTKYRDVLLAENASDIFLWGGGLYLALLGGFVSNFGAF
jgi:hypothetical protein